MTTAWQVVDCPCGHPLRLPFAITSTTQSVDGGLDVEVGYVAFDDHLDWHARRFHGGRDDLPLEVAA